MYHCRVDLPDNYIDAVAMFRVEKYHDCIDKLQDTIQDKTESPVKFQMMQIVGESYYMLYTLRQSSKRSKHSTVGGDDECYSNAKQAIRCLGIAYDNQIFTNEDISSIHLDLAMMDCIFNVRDKPLSRCLLCRRKCGKGQKLIHSHIWPEALLRHLASVFPSDSKQAFDTSWKGTGKLHGPGQIYFTMLCNACENLFSKYEKAFKSLCFEKLYHRVSADGKEQNIASDEIVMSTLKAPGVPESWLYFFCLSIAFRMFAVASQGHPANIGNFKNWYNSFTTWREILLNEGPTQNKPVPKIALFIAPVNVLEDLSPPMAKVLFSPGSGSFCAYRLHDGVSISSSKTEFLLSSIGVVNIVISNSEACFKFIPSECMVTLDSPEFVIPSAIRRYLLFPKAIWREYTNIAAIVTERTLNMLQDKVDAPFNKAWIGKEMKLFSGALGESFDASDVYMNFLPAPFDRIQILEQAINILKSCTMFKIIVHTWTVADDDDWFNLFVIRNNSQEAYPELFAIFIFQNKSYLISVAYKLSMVDLSVEEVIQASSTKAFFPQIENHFQIKMLLQAQLTRAIIKKAGFSDFCLFVNWLKDFK